MGKSARLLAMSLFLLPCVVIHEEPLPGDDTQVRHYRAYQVGGPAGNAQSEPGALADAGADDTRAH